MSINCLCSAHDRHLQYRCLHVDTGYRDMFCGQTASLKSICYVVKRSKFAVLDARMDKIDVLRVKLQQPVGSCDLFLVVVDKHFINIYSNINTVIGIV